MKFEKIFIPKEKTEPLGIKEINIQRLSSVVAFVGKNGSGKTRILDLIENNPFSVGTSVVPIPTDIINPCNKIQTLMEIQVLREEIKKDINNSKLQSQLVILERQVEQEKRDINGLVLEITSTIKKNHIRRIKYKDIAELQQELKENEGQLSFEKMIENTAKNINYNELTLINQGAFSYLVQLPHQLVKDFSECKINDKNIQDRVSYKRFCSLKKYIKNFLNKDLEWESKSSDTKIFGEGYNVTYKGFFKLNGRAFNYKEFSDGEKVLFSYALLFFLLDQNQRLNIKDCVVIIDEPELHLHPDAEIELLEGLKRVMSDRGQLIIATHSISILSRLNYEEIFMVKDGVVIPPSRTTPRNALSELISLEDKITRFSDFLDSIDVWSFVNFVSQCFNDPEVIISATPNDPQIKMLKEAIVEKGNNTSNMLLDFGAGRGRVYEQLKSDGGFFRTVNYYALEPKSEFHQDLKNLGIKNIYSEYSKLDTNAFDFILMCNVLHEIPIEKWEETINHLIDSLKEEGYLIIIEARTLKKGEKINSSGFLVLGEEEIKILFGLSDPISSFYTEDDKELIISIAINKSNINKISTNTIIGALRSLKNNMLKRMEELRTNSDDAQISYDFGRKAAFFAIQNINAELAIKKMEEKLSSQESSPCPT